LEKLLKPFSYLFHPLFIPLYGTLFYIAFSDNYLVQTKSYVLLFQIIIITILLPLLFFYLLKAFGKVDTIMISDANQRKIPLLLNIMLLGVLVTQGIRKEMFPELHHYLLGGLLSSILAFIMIYFKTKSSIHMLGMGALTFFVIGLDIANDLTLYYTIATLFVVTGFVASSRLVMKAHTLYELFFGYIIGIVPQIVLYKYWL